MKNLKSVVCAALLVTALSAPTFGKTGTISTTRTGTISTTKTGTISTTANGSSRNGTISTTRTGIISTTQFTVGRLSLIELVVTALRLW